MHELDGYSDIGAHVCSHGYMTCLRYLFTANCSKKSDFSLLTYVACFELPSNISAMFQRGVTSHLTGDLSHSWFVPRTLDSKSQKFIFTLKLNLKLAMNLKCQGFFVKFFFWILYIAMINMIKAQYIFHKKYIFLKKSVCFY